MIELVNAARTDKGLRNITIAVIEVEGGRAWAGSIYGVKPLLLRPRGCQRQKVIFKPVRIYAAMRTDAAFWATMARWAAAKQPGGLIVNEDERTYLVLRPETPPGIVDAEPEADEPEDDEPLEIDGGEAVQGTF